MSGTQTMFRVVKNGEFTTFTNALLRDTRLSYKARGVLVMCLSNSDQWEVHQNWISERGTEGREAIKGAMQELEAHGYVTYEETRDGGRFVKSLWLFHESPLNPEERTNRTNWQAEPCYGKPSHGKPCYGKPSDGKPYAKKEQEKERSFEETSLALALSDEVEKGKEINSSSIQQAWNLGTPNEIPKVEKMSDGRRKHAAARLADPWWRENWLKALRMIWDSDFLCGRVKAADGRRRFLADIDFFLRPDTVAKILEGKYANAPKPPEQSMREQSRKYL